MNLLKYLTSNFIFCVFPKEKVHGDFGIEFSDGDNACLCFTKKKYETEAEAVEAWNRRVENE